MFNVLPQKRASSAGRSSAGSRPGTPSRTAGLSSRTGTRRTSASNPHEYRIVALIENTAKEVGLCAHVLHSYEIELRQFADYNIFSTTMTILHMIDPSEIILSSASLGKALHQEILEAPHLSNKKVTIVNHIHFNETEGELFVNQYSISPCPILASFGPSACYLSLASCNALVNYVKSTGFEFMLSSLRIELCPNRIKMFLDIGALEGMDVVYNRSSTFGVDKEMSKHCLLHTIDYTKTRAGKRILRRDLLEPPSDLQTIQHRQDAVSAFCDSESMYKDVIAILGKFPDLERTIVSLLNAESRYLSNFSASYIRAQSPAEAVQDENLGSSMDDEFGANDEESQSESESDNFEASSVDDDVIPSHNPPSPESLKVSAPPSDILIQSLINVKAALSIVPDLCFALTGASSLMLRSFCSNLRSREYEELFDIINSVIDEDIMPVKSREVMYRLGGLAVKPGKNGRLDAFQKVLFENRKDMDLVARAVGETHNFQKVKLEYHVKRGYFLSAPCIELDRGSLPDEFILLQRNATKVSFTTDELDRVNINFKETLIEVWSMSAVEIGSVIGKILDKKYLMALYRLCDHVAMLDSLTSLVTYSSKLQVGSVRPEFHEDDALLILQRAHHPLLLKMNPQISVPNDVFFCSSSNLHIITGQNQSGKSTNIRMVGVNVILAHIGCHVPAEFMATPVISRICTRLGNNDDVSENLSHYSREMCDISAIFHTVPELPLDLNDGRNSALVSTMTRTTSGTASTSWDENKAALVLIDELGRSTTPTDGFAISWAVLEELAGLSNVFSLFTTHFHGLTALSSIYPTIRVLYCQTVDSSAEDGANNTGTIGNGSGASSGQEVRTNRYKRMDFTYKTCSGVCSDTWYGLGTGLEAGLPEKLIREAETLRDQIPLSSISTGKKFLRTHIYLTDEQRARLKYWRKVVAFLRQETGIRYLLKSEEAIRVALESLKAKYLRPEVIASVFERLQSASPSRREGEGGSHWGAGPSGGSRRNEDEVNANVNEQVDDTVAGQE